MTSKDIRVIKLNDCASFSQGKQIPVEEQYNQQDENMVRFVRIVDFTNPSEPARYIKNYGESYIVSEKDIIMIRYGSQTAGKVVRGIPGIIANNMFKICADENLFDKDFLYYFLSMKKIYDTLMQSQSSSTMPAITFGMLNNIEIPMFNIKTQKQIAKIIQKIDDKIELNNKINQNLEQQAQAIFNTYISKYSSTKYKVKDVILTANTGADAIQKAPIVDYDTRIRCVRVGDLSNNRNFWQWGFTKVTNDVFEQYQLKKDDIIVTRTATLGLNRLITENLSAVYNNGLIRITVDNNKIFPLLLYRHFQTKDFFNYINRIESETSVRPNMKINYLLDYEFSYLKLTEQNELVKILTALSQIVEINNAENEKLAQLRDTLLPKLMNGEIDVDKVEV